MSGPLEGLVQSVYRLASETLADELFEICEPRDGHITLSALLLQPHLLPDWLQSAGTIF